MPEINFLAHRQRQLDKQQEQDLKLLKIAGAVFGIALVVFVFTMGVMIYLRIRVNSLERQVSSLEQSILGQEDIEKSIVLSYEKLEVISKLFETRYDKQEAISFFSNLFGPNVLIKDIKYDSGEKILSLVVQASSVFEFDDILAKLDQPQVKEKFDHINQNDLRRNADAEYTVMLTMNLK